MEYHWIEMELNTGGKRNPLPFDENIITDKLQHI